MGFLDDVKDLAQKGLDVAQKGANEAREKANEVTLKRKLNGVAEELGHLVYRQRDGEDGLDPEIGKVIDQMRAIHQELSELED